MTTVINNLTNDLTGTSATVNLTPSSDVGYVQGNIYYRLLDQYDPSQWIFHGAYIGVPGVPGNYVVNGLTNNAFYEIKVVDSLATNYAVGDLPRRVMITDSGTSLLGRIMANLKSTAESIQKVNGYNFDVYDVMVIREAGDRLKEYPGIILYAPTNRFDDSHPLGAITKHLTVYVEGWFKAYEDINLEIELWEADIETAFLNDRRRGQNAVTTSIKVVERQLTNNDPPYGGCLFQVDIHFRTDFGNPYIER